MEQHIIRTSDRGHFKRCRQQWDFTSKIRQNYEPDKGIQALDFGTAIHAGLQALYDPLTWSDRTLREANAVAAFAATVAKHKQAAFKINSMAVDLESEFNERLQLGLDMLKYYFQWMLTADKDWTPNFVEIEFEVESEYDGPAGKVPFVYQGRVDAIVTFAGYDGYWIVDHKTTTQFNDTRWLALDDQCVSYVWALREQLGLNIRGVIYNELRKKPPKKPVILKSGFLSQNKQQDTTYEIYLEEIKRLGHKVEYYTDFLEHLKANAKEFVRRTWVPLSEPAIQMAHKRINNEARVMLENPIIYPSPSAWNCNGCSFLEPCLAIQEGRPEDAQFLLNELFHKREKDNN